MEEVSGSGVWPHAVVELPFDVEYILLSFSWLFRRRGNLSLGEFGLPFADSGGLNSEAILRKLCNEQDNFDLVYVQCEKYAIIYEMQAMKN